MTTLASPEDKLEEPSLVSIILPVFNDEDTIRESLESLGRQSYKNAEIIVVDDASTDGTRSIVQEIARGDSRIKPIDIQHSGTSGAKNIGFGISKGSVIFFAESDAVYSEDYLERALGCIRNDPKVGGVCVLGGVWETRRTFVTRSIDAENQIRDTLLIKGKRPPYFAWVFTREALERAGLYDLRLKQAEDRDLFSRVKNAGFKIGLVGSVLWRHRRNETTWQFAKKSFRKGKNRVAYLSKGGRLKELAKGVGGLWIAAALALISIAIPVALWVLFAMVIGIFAFYYARLVKLKLNTGLWSRRFLLLPPFQVLRYISTSLGYSAGVLRLGLG